MLSTPLFIKNKKGYCSKTCLDEPLVVDNINPKHYKIGGIETFDFIEAKLSEEQLSGFCKGLIFKYLARSDHKGKLEDLKKAKWYLDKLINKLDKSNV